MNSLPTGSLLEAALTAFNYLSETDPLPLHPVDAVIGFGTFDLELASHCANLHCQGRARQIIFTGGIGAGTCDLGGPEADAWRDHVSQTHPTIPPSSIIVENRSTNTAENIRFTVSLLAHATPPLRFGQEIAQALIVASPARLRRVKLTLLQLLPTLQVTRCPPPANFSREFTLHESKGLDYLDHLVGELDRIESYPARGWIAPEPLPEYLGRARTALRSRAKLTN